MIDSTTSRGTLFLWCLYRPSLVWVDTLTGKRISPSYNWLYVSFAISILFFSFLTRVHALSTNASLSRTLLRIPKGQPWKRIEKWLEKLQGLTPSNRICGVLVTLGEKLLRAIYAILSAVSDLYQSKLWELRDLDQFLH
jgi:hypothetical protein